MSSLSFRFFSFLSLSDENYVNQANKRARMQFAGVFFFFSSLLARQKLKCCEPLCPGNLLWICKLPSVPLFMRALVAASRRVCVCVRTYDEIVCNRITTIIINKVYCVDVRFAHFRKSQLIVRMFANLYERAQ